MVKNKSWAPGVRGQEERGGESTAIAVSRVKGNGLTANVAVLTQRAPIRLRRTRRAGKFPQVANATGRIPVALGDRRNSCLLLFASLAIFA